MRKNSGERWIEVSGDAKKPWERDGKLRGGGWVEVSREVGKVLEGGGRLEVLGGSGGLGRLAQR